MFYFKRKKVELKFFTSRPEVHEFAPIDYAKKFTPDWWKNLPNNNGFDFESKEIKKNMKGCVGVTGLMNKGFIMPLWSDAAIMVGAKGTNNYWYQFADKETVAVEHGQNQRGSFAPDDDYQHLKIVTPWIMQCKRDIPLYIGSASWHTPPNNMHILNGIVSPKYQTTTNVNILFSRTDKQQEFDLKLGQPIAQIIPMTDLDVRISTELVDSKEYNEIQQRTFSVLSFSHSYSKCKKLHKQRESKCPFGFGKK